MCRFYDYEIKLVACRPTLSADTVGTTDVQGDNESTWTPPLTNFVSCD